MANKYRYNDYYEMTQVFDDLYQKSKNNFSFRNLMDTISSENNIRLAFRMIKTNTGSQTAGVDNITIKDKGLDSYIKMVQAKLNNYKPDTVKRVYIPKADGKKRPLGIPTMVDRLVQQSIRQVLEPICEAKFHPHSYGFRPNRSTKHAISRMMSLINIGKMYYTVDIDIKGFFDNVNHTKLVKQMYALGIQDRKLISIIKAMLKAPIQGEGIPKKGTPQGGILSPLLSNIVLNELDWWISSQWETFKTIKKYKTYASQYNQQKKTNLKQMYIVRYADDFKIMCRNYNTAKRIYTAVKEWLNIRLKLEISEEKSKIINLRKNYSDFLGVKIKAVKKGKTFGGYVAQSHISGKAMKRMSDEIRSQVELIAKQPESSHVTKLNSMILGWHEYYSCATYANIDFSKLAFSLDKFMLHKLRNVANYGTPKRSEISPLYKKFYGNSKAKTWKIHKVFIYPIDHVQHKPVMNFSQDICDYTQEGRNKSSKKLENSTNNNIIQLMKNYNPYETAEYNDNRISRASMTKMKCEVTKIELAIDTLHCHHVIPRELGGTDGYQNLRIVHKDVHKLIHAIKPETIEKYSNLIEDKKALNKLNKLRTQCSLEPINLVTT
ncbi:group II intron reverse transcriptase/maturase [Niallia circulans]|uniref:group II intron reverse transcriptase/maturase n=1 Tax=Niallia circulans TaxID=1397 RepID=UPI001F17934A|nr:group II intron reverse transcriptase/maturase [Niallia circulans]MCF2647332.1 group II intron reverse transcriptase/maturase [Niallia circulans]